MPVQNDHIKNKLQKHVTELLQWSDVKRILLKLYFNTQPPVITDNHKTQLFLDYFSEGKQIKLKFFFFFFALFETVFNHSYSTELKVCTPKQKMGNNSSHKEIIVYLIQ